MQEEPSWIATIGPQRSLLSMLRFARAADEETFRCHVCYDDVVVSKAVALTSCGHKYCASCLKPYLELKIAEGNVYPVCFHPIDSAGATCGVAVTPDQIEQLVTPRVYTKYGTFRFNKEHQHARECPYCKHSQECVGPKNPGCVCAQCGKVFCFFHGNAHEDGTCADYELKHAREEALSRAKIIKISKPCPGCHCDVEKDGGCNHMKCVGCKTNFCWLCGEMVEDTSYPSHYAAGSGGSCSGKQFGEMVLGLDLEQEQTQAHLQERRSPDWVWPFHALMSRYSDNPPDQRTLSPGQWAAATLTVIPSILLALVIGLALSPLLWVYDRSMKLTEALGTERFAGTLGAAVGWLFFLFGTLLNLVFTPVRWVVDLAVTIVKITVGIIAEIRTQCFSCWCRSGPSVADTPFANDLEAGLVEATVAGAGLGPAAQGEPRSFAV